MKTKTITVAHGIPSKDHVGVYDYRVEKVTDSVEFHPRQILTKKQVDELCSATGWKVTVIALEAA
ncbi:MAG TPA: hypothetical protein VFB29_00275 [Pseudolabrys sp.]|nr:hypothetical protein [Pseudolabrys sp.]